MEMNFLELPRKRRKEKAEEKEETRDVERR